jgi:2,5-diamino-6-(ribosylamino)-4(3H)-pyrimidinone 5'-phosphate reductase
MPSTPPAFLVEHVQSRIQEAERSGDVARIPFVTVTWAQSLDFKIAGPGGKRVLISGPESMEMTHW